MSAKTRLPLAPSLASMALLAVFVASCDRPDASGPDVAALAGMPIHLEERLDSAEIAGAEVHTDLGEPMAWAVDDGLANWRALPNFVDGGLPFEVEAADDALRLRVTEKSFAPDNTEELHGGIYLDVPGFVVDSWRQVEVRARITGPAQWLGIGYDLRETPGDEPREQWPTRYFGAGTGVDPDGAVHTYRFGLVGQGGPVPGEARQISLEFGATGPAQIEILSVSLESAAANYALQGIGVRSVLSTQHEEFGPQRRTIYAHVPARISYPLRVPAAGRLDLALGSLAGASAMSVRVDFGDSTKEILSETVPPDEAWRQRSLDLSRWAGRDVTLSLVAETAAESDGEDGDPAVAFWASPTVSSATESPALPNVVFYVIDGASAYLMSVYGYERPTTPNLEGLAEEGVVFEQAHSNATWTMPSTASFMTSLHHSVLGGLKNDANPIPPNAKTMAQHFHEAGFHTGVFTFNPNAGGLSGLDRAVDVFRDFGKRGNPLDPIEAISSKVLQGQFWQWRDAYPGPYWAHFQTTDVHPPHHPQDPFAGRFVPKEESEALTAGLMKMRFPFNHTSASVHEHWQEQLRLHGRDPHEFYSTMLDMHDEAMLHQDHQIGELVKELKARGEWQNTLLVIGSDHGHPAASYPRFGRGLLDPQPEPWEGALLGQFESHVPLIFVWPGKIDGGRRVQQPVSMIDVLPTILDLAGLPRPEIAQGRSLAPLLLENAELELRPVVFEEFRVVDDGSLLGNLEILDGRWGHSLEIRSGDELPPPLLGRHPAPAGGRWKALEFADVPRYLLYDLEADPRAVSHVAQPDPQLADDAQRRLWRLWQEHRALAARFETGEEAELSPEQVEALKALGYVE